jgi:hypothetical protein
MKNCIATLLLLNSLAIGQETSTLWLKTHVALPNVDGRMDHFSVDIKGQRLFGSALGNNTIEVIDLQSGRRVRTLPGLAGPEGLFYDASTNRLYGAVNPSEIRILKPWRWRRDCKIFRVVARALARVLWGLDC